LINLPYTQSVISLVTVISEHLAKSVLGHRRSTTTKFELYLYSVRCLANQDEQVHTARTSNGAWRGKKRCWLGVI